nr:collagen alpha-1(I) chain-like [Symphalangus syndactylus]
MPLLNSARIAGRSRGEDRNRAGWAPAPREGTRPRADPESPDTALCPVTRPSSPRRCLRVRRLGGLGASVYAPRPWGRPRSSPSLWGAGGEGEGADGQGQPRARNPGRHWREGGNKEPLYAAAAAVALAPSQPLSPQSGGGPAAGAWERARPPASPSLPSPRAAPSPPGEGGEEGGACVFLRRAPRLLPGSSRRSRLSSRGCSSCRLHTASAAARRARACGAAAGRAAPAGTPPRAAEEAPGGGAGPRGGGRWQPLGDQLRASASPPPPQPFSRPLLPHSRPAPRLCARRWCSPLAAEGGAGHLSPVSELLPTPGGETPLASAPSASPGWWGSLCAAGTMRISLPKFNLRLAPSPQPLQAKPGRWGGVRESKRACCWETGSSGVSIPSLCLIARLTVAASS